MPPAIVQASNLSAIFIACNNRFSPLSCFAGGAGMEILALAHWSVIQECIQWISCS